MTTPTPDPPSIMDLASRCGHTALFAGFQAAMVELLNVAMHGDFDREYLERYHEAEARVRRAIEVGDTYGSPAHLASLRPTGGDSS